MKETFSANNVTQNAYARCYGQVGRDKDRINVEPNGDIVVSSEYLVEETRTSVVLDAEVRFNRWSGNLPTVPFHFIRGNSIRVKNLINTEFDDAEQTGNTFNVLSSNPASPIMAEGPIHAASVAVSSHIGESNMAVSDLFPILVPFAFIWHALKDAEKMTVEFVIQGAMQNIGFSDVMNEDALLDISRMDPLNSLRLPWVDFDDSQRNAINLCAGGLPRLANVRQNENEHVTNCFRFPPIAVRWYGTPKQRIAGLFLPTHNEVLDAMNQLCRYYRQTEATVQAFTYAALMINGRFIEERVPAPMPQLPPAPNPFVGNPIQTLCGSNNPPQYVFDLTVGDLKRNHFGAVLPLNVLQDWRDKMTSHEAAQHQVECDNLIANNTQHDERFMVWQTSLFQRGGVDVPSFRQHRQWPRYRSKKFDDHRFTEEQITFETLTADEINLYSALLAGISSVAMSSWFDYCSITGHNLASALNNEPDLRCLNYFLNQRFRNPKADVQPIFEIVLSTVSSYTGYVISNALFVSKNWCHHARQPRRGAPYSWHNYDRIPYNGSPLGVCFVTQKLIDVWGLMDYPVTWNIAGEVDIALRNRGWHPKRGDSTVDETAISRYPYLKTSYSNLALNVLLQQTRTNVPVMVYNRVETGYGKVVTTGANIPDPFVGNIPFNELGHYVEPGSIITYDWTDSHKVHFFVPAGNFEPAVWAWLCTLTGAEVTQAGIKFGGGYNDPKRFRPRISYRLPTCFFTRE